MSAWSSYRIRDFLLFSKDTLFEIIDAYNHDFWPWQIPGLILAFVMLVLARQAGSWRTRLLFALVAGAWIWVGLVFLLQYFLPINWAARTLAWIFFAEALAILIAGPLLGRLKPALTRRQQNLGLGLFILSAFIPWELFAGHSLSHIMIFGWGPERTAVGTLGLLLTLRPSPWSIGLMFPPLILGLLSLLMYSSLP